MARARHPRIRQTHPYALNNEPRRSRAHLRVRMRPLRRLTPVDLTGVLRRSRSPPGGRELLPAQRHLLAAHGTRRHAPTHAVRDSLHRSGRWLDIVGYAVLHDAVEPPPHNRTSPVGGVGMTRQPAGRDQPGPALTGPGAIGQALHRPDPGRTANRPHHGRLVPGHLRLLDPHVLVLRPAAGSRRLRARPG